MIWYNNLGRERELLLLLCSTTHVVSGWPYSIVTPIVSSVFHTHLLISLCVFTQKKRDPTRPDPTTCHTVHFGRGPSLAWLTCSSTLHYAIRICIIDEYGLPHIDQLGFNSYLDQDRRVCLEPTYHAIFSPPSLEPSTHRPSSDIWIVDEAPWVMDS